MSPFLNDSIRLSKKNQDKLKEGNAEAYELINRPQKKFEKSISIGGAICFYGLSNLLLLEGTENEFAYAQALYYYKDDIEKINRNNKCSLLFEQEQARAHTSKSNINLLNNLFTPDGWIQNPPNSPDIAYPIETLWATLKKGSKTHIKILLMEGISNIILNPSSAFLENLPLESLSIFINLI